MLCLLPALWLLCTGSAAAGADLDELRLCVCPLRRADAMVLVQGSHAALIDTGEAPGCARHRRAAEEAAGCVAGIRAEHPPHHDHLGGLPALLAQCRPECFLTGFPEDLTGMGVVQGQAMAALQDAGVPVFRVCDGDELALGDAEITVLQAGSGTVNDRSVVLKVAYGRCSLLLTGDTSPSAQRDLARRADLRADILKVPRHGLGAMSRAFLRTVSPSCAFITNNTSRGTGRARQQPDDAAIPWMQAEEGTLCLYCDGSGWRWEVLPPS